MRPSTGSRLSEKAIALETSTVNEPGASTVTRVVGEEFMALKSFDSGSAGATLEERGESGVVVVIARSCSEAGIRCGRRRKVLDGAIRPNVCQRTS